MSKYEKWVNILVIIILLLNLFAQVVTETGHNPTAWGYTWFIALACCMYSWCSGMIKLISKEVKA